MITLLERLLIKNRSDVSNPSVRQAYGMLCGSVGIFLNILLFAGKFIAGTLSNSIAITADAFNNLSDAGSSIITLLGFKLAGQKPDPDHPFGHGRIEYISGLIVSAAILIMAFELVKSSVTKIIHPDTVAFSYLSILILIVSILVKIYMFLYNRKIAVKINSTAMKATSMDSLSDSLSTSIVLISSIIGMFTGVKIDGYCGVLVGLFIFYTGYSAAKDTITPLLGQAPDDDFVDRINQIVMSYEGVIGIHDLIVHDYGPGRIMISLHAEVPATGDIIALHDMIDNIEVELHTTLNVDAVIHMDPVITDDEEVNQIKTQTLQIINDLDPDLTCHDFRVVKGPTHTNVIFDIVAPYNYKDNDENLKEKISERIKELNENYVTVLQIDRPYTKKK